MRRLAIAALAAFALDQLSKLWVVWGLNLLELQRIEVAPPYLVFRMAWNRGINFGLFEGNSDVSRWALVLLSIAVSVFVVTWIRREPQRPLAEISAGLLVGGALGNALDRVLYGAVADFLNMSCCGYRNPFSFNVADIAIFAGAIGLILFTGDRGKPDDAAPKAE